MNLVFSNLRLRFFVLIVLAVSLALIIKSYYSIHRQNHSFNQTQLNNIRATGMIVSDILADSVSAYDFTSLNQIMRELTAQKSVLYSAVIGANKIPMSISIKRSNRSIAKALSSLGIKTFSQDNWHELASVLKSNKTVDELSFPIVLNQKLLAHLRIGVSKDAMQEMAAQAWSSELIANGIIVVLLIICLVVTFKYTTLRPIRRLMAGVNKVAAGELNKPIQITSNDEFGELSASFNQMLYSLRIAMHEKELVYLEVQTFNKSLQKDIESRTQALIEAQAYTRAILETVSEGIITIDKSGFILSTNTVAEKYFAAHAGEMIGLHSSLLLADKHWNGCHEMQGYRDEKQGPFSVKYYKTKLSYEGVRFNGSAFPLECEVSQLYSNNEMIRLLVIRDISYKRELEDRVSDLTYNSGMTETTIGVLYNLSSILNSARVACTEILNISGNSKVTDLDKANQLLFDNLNHLADFIKNDPKGRMLPDYLVKLADLIKQELSTINKEGESLQQKIQIMQDMLDSQQSYVKSGCFVDNVQIEALVENSLQQHAEALHSSNIQVERNYDLVPDCKLNKSKLAQVINHLLENAIEAVTDNDLSPAGKKIIIVINNDEENKQIQLHIIDNGIGISKENLSTIFNYGFSTKSDSHGIGLHVCTSTISEMGGMLLAHSDGLRQGAKFSLIIPYSCANLNYSEHLLASQSSA